LTDQTNFILSSKIEAVASEYLEKPSNVTTARSSDNDVDKILADEFNNLNIKKRNDVQEEIHGVYCMAPEETPELLAESLSQLDIELDHIPQSQKYAYTRSLQLQSQQQNQQQDPSQSKQLIYYVNSNEFRLMYLRSELFDARKAAYRIVKALDFLLELFGEIAFKRKIRLSDFTKKELKIMKRGYIQLLPSRDRGGRRIIVVITSWSADEFDLNILIKILFYLFFVCGSTDIENQKKGIVFIVWADQFSNHRFSSPERKTTLTYFPCRIVSIHFCAKESLFTNLFKAILVARLNTELRIRFVCSLAECVEVRYMLQRFGIPINELPVTWTGMVKTENMKRLMTLRTHVEKESIVNNNNNNLLSSSSTIIDCPYLNDILFKRGRNQVIDNAGNMKFQSIVHSVYVQHLEQLRQRSQSPNCIHVSVKVLISDIMNEIQKENLRVLVWDIKNSWWNCVLDERDYRKYIYQSATYILKESTKASLAIGVGTSPSPSTSTSSYVLNGKVYPNKPKQQTTQSDTTIFLPEDGKRRKRSHNNDTCNHHRGSNNNDDNSDDCVNTMACDECFGLPFVPMQKDNAK